MATFSLRVVVPIRGYHVYKEAWESSLLNRATFKRHNGRRLRIAVCITCRCGCVELSQWLKMPHSSSLEHASCTGVSGVIQVGLLGNLGECKNSSTTEIVSHRKAVELK